MLMVNNADGSADAAMDGVWTLAGEPSPMPPYTGFPIWHALLVPPSIVCELRAMVFLKRMHVIAYRPTFFQKVRRRGGKHAHIARAVVPGMLFVPAEFLQVDRRDELLDLCHVHGYLRTAGGDIAKISKAAMEVIREIEAKLSLPPVVTDTGHAFKVGQVVVFCSTLYAAFLGTAKVMRLEGKDRIIVEVDQLFGRSQQVVVRPSEIEAK
jgi:transcription antitermination factor NusG